MRKFFRGLLASYVRRFGTVITDQRTGEKMARALIFSWGGTVYLIGYEGKDQVRPVFLPQERMTLWKRKIGFTTHPAPDYSREPSAAKLEAAPGICFVLLSHLPPDKTLQLIRRWRNFYQEPSRLLLCYGGTKENFAAIGYADKLFIDDPRLRTRDHQREKQSYSGIVCAVAQWLGSHPECGYVYLAEFDHWPLVKDLGARLIERLHREQADVLGHQLARRDLTSCVYYLNHIHDDRFLPWLQKISRRDEPGAVFNMFGSGSFWTREAFLAVAAEGEPVPVYLETYLPTLAHHLGFRVRDFQDQSRYVTALGDRFAELEEATRAGAWTLHPVKTWPS